MEKQNGGLTTVADMVYADEDFIVDVSITRELHLMCRKLQPGDLFIWLNTPFWRHLAESKKEPQTEPEAKSEYEDFLKQSSDSLTRRREFREIAQQIVCESVQSIVFHPARAKDCPEGTISIHALTNAEVNYIAAEIQRQSMSDKDQRRLADFFRKKSAEIRKTGITADSTPFGENGTTPINAPIQPAGKSDLPDNA